MPRMINGKHYVAQSKALPSMPVEKVTIKLNKNISRNDKTFHNMGILESGKVIHSHGNDEKSIIIKHKA